MARNSQHLDNILRDWPYTPGEVSARLIRGSDGRELIQMRVELGLLQMETERRPDGERPEGAETYFDYLLALAVQVGDGFTLTEEQCQEVDREFLQYYQRRICWLALREFDRAVRDADHNLALMDFVRDHSPDEQWTMSHEQYRPFVLFHRTQAAALAALDNHGAESAIEEISGGLERIRAFFADFEVEEHFEDDEMVLRLHEMQESLREQFGVERTLGERLEDAIRAEKYELAAELRDELARRKPGTV